MAKWKKECAVIEEQATEVEEEIRIMQKRYKNMPHLMPALPEVPRPPPAPVRPKTPEKADRPPNSFFTLGSMLSGAGVAMSAQALGADAVRSSAAADPTAADGARLRASRGATARMLLSPSMAAI